VCTIKVLLDSATRLGGKGSEGYIGDAAEIGAARQGISRAFVMPTRLLRNW
jgi:hypothetical protein